MFLLATGQWDQRLGCHLTVQMAVVLLACVIAGCGTSKSSDPGEELTEVNHRQKLGKLKYQRDKLRLSLSRLEDDRQAILFRLRQAGVTSTDDLSDHPEWRIHARELKDVVGRIRRMEKTATAYDQAIARMEVILREEDREARLRGAALSEDELNELSRITHELDDQLQTDSDVPGFEDLELESLLNQELKSKPTGETR